MLSSWKTVRNLYWGYNADGSPQINPNAPLYSEKGFSTEPEYRETDYYLMDGYNDNNYPDVTPERDGKRLIVQPNTFNMYCKFPHLAIGSIISIT